MPPRRAVSLFTNCGAGDSGYHQAGFDFDVLAEVDPRRLAVASANTPGADAIGGDLRETWPQVVAAWRRRHGRRPPDLLVACPPCQGMSSLRAGLHGTAISAGDTRNLLSGVIAQIAAELRPRIVVCENVPSILTRNVGGGRTAVDLLTCTLTGAYYLYPIVGDLADWGVPQRRNRAFLTLIGSEDPARDLLAATNTAPYPAPADPVRHVTVKQALRALGACSLDAATPETATCGHNEMHKVPTWGDPHRYKTVAAIPPGSGQSAYANEECARCGPVDVDEDAAMCPQCTGPLLRPVVAHKPDGWRLIRGFRSSSYRRMHPDRPAATITTATGHVGSAHTVHPYENRVLSPHECAHLQTIPADYDWGDTLDEYGSTFVRAMIGEALPPLFAQAHGAALNELLAGATTRLIGADDERCTTATDRMNKRRRSHRRRRETSPGTNAHATTRHAA